MFLDYLGNVHCSEQLQKDWKTSHLYPRKAFIKHMLSYLKDELRG